MKNFNVREFIRFCLSCMIYYIVELLFVKYVVSKNIDTSLQITAWVVMLVYTIYQIQYIFRYMFNFIKKTD